MNSNTNYNHKSESVPWDRPQSSRFPQLVSRSPENQSFRGRSSSYHHLFDFESENNLSKLKTNEKQLKEYSDEKDNKLLNNSKSTQPSNMTAITSVSSTDEYQKLKSENQILKNNFLRMSRIIQKHSRLMAKKDEIILRLQERSASNNFPTIKKDNEQVDSSNISVTSIRSEELKSKNIEFSTKFRQIYGSMIEDFGQHLTQFVRVIEEMQKYLENNLKVMEQKYSNDLTNSDIETKYQAINSEFSDLKSKYEVLSKENTDFKSLIEFYINSFDLKDTQNMTTIEMKESLRKHLTEFLEKSQLLSTHLKDMKKCRKTEEDYCFSLIEALSEAELELELLGRNPQTLGKIIEKFEEKLFEIQQKLSQTYLQSLNKILLQLYKNQLKWFQFVHKPSKSTQTWVQTKVDDSSTEEEDIVSGTDWQKSEIISDISNIDERVVKSNDISEEIKTKFDELSDEMSFDDFDIESINYILMSKHFDHNMRQNLEVVEEVEEENLEEECSLSYDDTVFEDSDQYSEICSKVIENIVTEKYVNNEIDLENIESIVKQVLNQVLDEIESEFNKEIIDSDMVNKQGSNLTNDSYKERQDSLIDCQTPVRLEVKPPYIDSDFVSDDLSSSPETVRPYPDNNKDISKIEQAYFKPSKSTFAYIKQQNTSIDDNQSSTEQHLLSFETKENQYLRDELKAWREMVVQQKDIMEKIRNELELQHKLNEEKDKTIESLKSLTIEEIKSDFPENSEESHTSGKRNVSPFVDSSDDECKASIDELDLDMLFVSSHESDDTDIGLNELELSDEKDFHNQAISGLDRESDDNITPDSPNTKVWDKRNHFIDQNHVSDESLYSVYTENSSPLSVPEELLQTNRRKVFIPYSHEEATVRRHSCSDRIIRYGNHPRKKKLELKNIDIVYQGQKMVKDIEIKSPRPLNREFRKLKHLKK